MHELRKDSTNGISFITKSTFCFGLIFSDVYSKKILRIRVIFNQVGQNCHFEGRLTLNTGCQSAYKLHRATRETKFNHPMRFALG